MKIKIDGWKSNLTFSCAHFLPDYSKCSRLHGHTYAIHVYLEGEPKQDILFDFREIKKILIEIINEIDHKVLIPTEGKLQIKENMEEIEVIHEDKRYVFPKDDCALLPIYSSSAENLASFILKRVVEKIINSDNRIKVIEVGVDEGYGQGAWAKWEKKRYV